MVYIFDKYLFAIVVESEFCRSRSRIYRDYIVFNVTSMQNLDSGILEEKFENFLFNIDDYIESLQLTAEQKGICLESTVTDCGAEGSQATDACAATCWAAPGLTRILTEAYWGWE